MQINRAVNLRKVTSMAKRKVIHPLYYNGTIGNITFYTMYGQLYARSKSSLTAKRVRSDKKFHKTMKFAGMMAKASSIGSNVYKALPVSWRQSWMYRAFTGEALQMLMQGIKEELILKS